MSIKIVGGNIYKDGAFVENESLVFDSDGEDRVIELGNSYIMPGFCDVHVHFREPGQSYKETIRSGSLAAARGGYTAVCTMPNVDPAPHDMQSLQAQLDIIEKDACIKVIPYGTITDDRSGRGRLSDMEAMAPYVCGFSDDGTGVQEAAEMRDAMEAAHALGKLIVAHCEDEKLAAEGSVREAEWKQIERDVKLADETGASYHVCHISCRESVEIIRDAKKSGVDVTCETAPHYLLLDAELIWYEINRDPYRGGRFRMNPEVKTIEDMDALIDGAVDGTIDMIATDHAPHSPAEKFKPYDQALNGVSGLECAFSVLYTGLVKPGIMGIDRLIEMMAYAPRERFDIEQNGYAIFDIGSETEIDPNAFISMGKATPFERVFVYAQPLMTVYDNVPVYISEDLLHINTDREV